MKAKRNDHFTCESVIDGWCARPRKRFISGAILSFDAVCVDSPVIIMLQKVHKYCKYKHMIELGMKFH